MSSVGHFSSVVWEDLGEPESPSVYYISGWATYNIGKLNIIINECFSVNESGDFTPQFDNQVSGIYEEYFNYKLYEKKIRDSMNSYIDKSNSGSLDWIVLSEGDSSIRRADPAQMTRIYKDLKVQSKAQLDKLISDYKFNRSIPNQVVGDDSKWPL